MKKVIRIFIYEYTRHVFRKRFFIALFSAPLMIGLMLAVSIFAAFVGLSHKPLGYVDEAGWLDHPIQPPRSLVSSGFFPKIELRAYPSEETARAALEDGQIQGYYVIQPDYLQTSQVKLVAYKVPDNSIQNQFREFIRANLLAKQPTAVVQRILKGDSLISQSLDGSRQMAAEDWINLVIPFVAGFLFLMITFTSGSYLMHALVEEKENRTMEILVTSVSPGELMAGKTLGNMTVGLTQMLVWIILGLGLVGLAQAGLSATQHVEMDGQFWVLMILVFLPAFMLVSALMATLGATLTEGQEAQQISSVFTLLVVSPYWLAAPIINSPNSPLSVGLSLFPLTAPITLTLRGAFTTVPTWQMLTSIAILVVCASGAIWLAGRAFRLGMLRYGKRLAWREIFTKTSRGTQV